MPSAQRMRPRSRHLGTANTAQRALHRRLASCHRNMCILKASDHPGHNSGSPRDRRARIVRHVTGPHRRRGAKARFTPAPGKLALPRDPFATRSHVSPTASNHDGGARGSAPLRRRIRRSGRKASASPSTAGHRRVDSQAALHTRVPLLVRSCPYSSGSQFHSAQQQRVAQYVPWVSPHCHAPCRRCRQIRFLRTPPTPGGAVATLVYTRLCQSRRAERLGAPCRDMSQFTLPASYDREERERDVRKYVYGCLSQKASLDCAVTRRLCKKPICCLKTS